MKREEITAIIEKNSTQNLQEIQSLLEKNSQSLKEHLQKELKNEKSEIDQSLKNHRSKIYQKIDKVFKEKIKILDINILTAILSMLVITMVFQVCIFALIIWRL